jgi:hypothetical protein
MTLRDEWNSLKEQVAILFNHYENKTMPREMKVRYLKMVRQLLERMATHEITRANYNLMFQSLQQIQTLFDAEWHTPKDMSNAISVHQPPSEPEDPNIGLDIGFVGVE